MDAQILDNDEWSYYERSIPKEKIDETIIDIYKDNVSEINKAKNNGAPEPIINSVKKINNAVYNNTKILHSKQDAVLDVLDVTSPYVEEQKRARLTFLKKLGETIRRANQSFKLIGVSVYDKVAYPIGSLFKVLYKSDIKSCKKELLRTQQQYEKIKEKIDVKALRRLRRINLFNMKKGRKVYSEKHLPYSSKEQKIITSFETKIKELKAVLDVAQNRYNQIIENQRKRTEFINTNKQNPQPKIEKEVTMDNKPIKDIKIAVDEKNSIGKKEEKRNSININTTQNHEIKYKSHTVPKHVIAQLKQKHLSMEQFREAFTVARFFPEFQIEKRDIAEISFNKYLYLAKLNHDNPNRYNFDQLKEKGIQELSALVNNISKETDCELHIKEDSSNNQVESKDIKEKEEMTDTNIELKEYPTRSIILAADLNSAAIQKTDTSTPVIISNDDEKITDVRDCNPSLFDKSLEENISDARKLSANLIAEKAYDIIESKLKEGEKIDFEIEGNAYSAEKQNGELIVCSYSFEDSKYSPLTKEIAIMEFSKNSKEITKTIQAQFTDKTGKESHYNEMEKSDMQIEIR